jgi:putative glycosyltransferase (TIGR04372 family)
MDYDINNKTVWQFVKYIFAKLREKGIWYGFKRQVPRLLFRIISVIAGILAYPFCLITNTRFVSFYVRSIGMLCVEPDCYIKEGILGMRPRYNSIVLAPRGTVANEHMLNYWKRYDIKVIESPIACFLLAPLARNRFSGYDALKYAFDYNPAFVEIQKKYKGRPPLLKLTEADIERGWKLLKSLGMPKNAWFVCIHCREDGYLGDVDQSNRNCDINNYLPAMESIVKKGGWVIRMGDPTMKNIPPMEHAIDYAHLEIKSDWMDIFLSASCRFFLGSNSGLCYVAYVFAVPSAIANFAPIGGTLPYGADDIAIPKLLWSVEKGRFLTFREAFDSPVSNYRLDSSIHKAGVRPVENSPEDITNLAMEMIDRAGGKISYTDDDEILQGRFKSLMKPCHYSYGAVSKVGRDFLRKYRRLLDA